MKKITFNLRIIHLKPTLLKVLVSFSDHLEMLSVVRMSVLHINLTKFAQSFLIFFKGNSELLDKGRSPFQKSGPGNHETVTIGNAPLKITTLKTTALEISVLTPRILFTQKHLHC